LQRRTAALAFAGWRIDVRSQQTLRLFDANPTAYIEKELGAGNMPVISAGRMFIRTPGEFICYDIRESQQR